MLMSKLSLVLVQLRKSHLPSMSQQKQIHFYKWSNLDMKDMSQSCDWQVSNAHAPPTQHIAGAFTLTDPK